MNAADRAYATRVRADNWGNFSVLRHGRFDGMLVTSKNSGTHWVKYMLAVALAETHSVPPPPYFSENAVRPYIGWPKDKPTFPELPRLAFSHTIPHRLMDWGWARAAAQLPKYVLLVRHPMEILASHYDKWHRDEGLDWLTYLRGDPSGRRYRCDLYWLARFWNRWGDLLARIPEQIHLVQYEQALADPRGALVAISDHWGLALPTDAIDSAVKAGSKDAMAQKIDPDAEANVLQRRKADTRERFTGEAAEVYREIVGARFGYGLGYDLAAA